MNTKKDCCDLRDASHALSAEYPCTCLCHLDSTQESGPSEEKIQAGLKALFGPAPQHTSPEKEERRYFGRELGAYAEEQRPDDWTLSRHPTFLQGGSSVEVSHVKEPSEVIKETLNNKETMLEVARKATNDQREQIGLPPLEPSFTEKTLAEFREKLSEGIQTRMLEQWLSSKLKESAENERSRILTLIENRKKAFEPGEMGSSILEDPKGTDCYNLALTSLAAELQDA